MASRKKSTKTEKIVNEIDSQEVNILNEIDNQEELKENITEQAENITEQTENITEQAEKTNKTNKNNKNNKNNKKLPKFAIGSVVFVSKDAQADLNGFKLFPPYKKYTYTVEAYNEDTGVYSLRRLNLSLRLKESDIVAPGERAHDPLNRRQF